MAGRRLSKNTVNVPKCLLYDGHGSVRHLANNAGALISGQAFNYDAYGNLLGTVTPQTNLLYAGEMWDADLGQYYLRARYYDPLNGRFNRMDPFGGNNQDPQSLHKYLYAHCNPINGIDPTGNFSLMSILTSSSVDSVLRKLDLRTSTGAAKFAAKVTVGALVLRDFIQGMRAGPTLDAFILGAGVSIAPPKWFGRVASGLNMLGLGPAFNLDMVWGRHSGNRAYYLGGFLTTNNSLSWGAYAGLAFNTPSSFRYRGFSRSITIDLRSANERIKKFVTDAWVKVLPSIHKGLAGTDSAAGELAGSIPPEVVSKFSRGMGAYSRVICDVITGRGGSLTLWGGGDTSFGFTLAPRLPFVYRSGRETISASLGRYFQIWPRESRDWLLARRVQF